MTAEQAKFLLDLELPMMEREQALTQRVLAAIPAEKGDYRPDPNARSAFELAWHIASAENMFLDAVITGQFNFGARRPETIRTTTDVTAWYEEQMQNQRSRLAQVSPAQLAQAIDFRGVLQLPAVAFLSLAMRHTSHHRGQLSTYLRPMGGRVPAIYGESYDSAQARQAAG